MEIRNFYLINIIINIKSLFNWLSRDFQNFAPGFIKRKVIKTYAKKKSILIETGTHRGDNIYNLKNHFFHIYSVEASNHYFEYSKKRLNKIKNISLIKGTSQTQLENIVKDCIKKFKNKEIVFYLDAHYSGEGTFKGNITAIKSELSVIKKYIRNFSNVVIIIDDFRMFGLKKYFTKNYLVKYSMNIKKKFNVQYDMFICY